LLLPLLNKALSEKSKVVCNQKRFEKHLTIHFDKTNKAFDNWCRFTPIATTQGIKILFYCERGVLLTSSNDFQKDFNQSEIKTVISRVNSTIDEVERNRSAINVVGDSTIFTLIILLKQF
jgi:hypothetical protein